MITKRIHIPGGMYHITQRGNFQNNIFFTNEDRSYFCLLMQKYFTRYNHRVHAFCLMDNHIHLLVQAGPLSFAKAMQCITSLYARKLNKRCKTKGHRFQGRYYSSIVDTDNHLLTVLKYIHLNPGKAKMVNTPEQYFWQTHNHYTLTDNTPWVERNFCLSLFDTKHKSAIEEYGRFMEYDLNDKERKKIQSPTHGYIIGSDQFIFQAQAKAAEFYLINHINAEKVLRARCDYFHYPINSLRRTGKDQVATTIRGIAGYILCNHTNISQAALVKLFNRSASTISHSIKTITKKILVDQMLQKTVDKILDRITPSS